MTISIEQADSYHQSRGNVAWATLTETQKTAALAKADDYITAYYKPFKPEVESDDPNLIIATSSLALELENNPVDLKAQQPLKAEEITNGDKSIKTTYQDADKAPALDPYPFVTAMLAPLRVALTVPNGVIFSRMTR